MRVRLISGTGFRLVAVALTAALSPACAQPEISASTSASVPQTAAGPRTRALLVGVTTFVDPAMAKHNLKGPANDVELFRHVLEAAPFGVSPSDITTLSGLPAHPGVRPTRANIEREFQRLKAVSAPGDQVVVLLAGHGSQQPANEEADDPEPDGFDEIFLTADASGWDPERHRVRNALVDDDLRRWVTDIRNAGAFVWVIVDACQSGTMTRGGPEVLRQVPVEDLVPPAEIARARARGASSTGPATDSAFELVTGAGDIAALYAANMNETTPERPLPGRDSPVHGLFTYTLASILSQSSTAMTYRELNQQVLERYRALQRFAPTPMLEGGGLDREVLGVRTWPDRARMMVHKTSNGGWEVDAGSIHGLTPGSILQVFPPAGTPDAEKPLGYGRVVSTTATQALFEPVEYERTAPIAAGRLADGSRARVRAYSAGEMSLTVAVQQVDGNAPAGRVVASGRGPRAIEAALADLARASNGLARRVDDDSADWFVQVSGDTVRLVPTAGWQTTSGRVDQSGGVEAPPQFVLGGVGDAGLGARLIDSIRRIARAGNLMRLAAQPVPNRLVEIVPVRLSSEGEPLPRVAGPVAVRIGQQVELRARNLSAKPIDLTVLHVDAELGITALFPQVDEAIDNQLRPGEERNLGRFKVEGPYVGWEYTIAIAVESTAVRRNFAVLQQPSLPTTRGATIDPSPLRRLLEDALFGTEAGVRGLKPQPIDAFSMTLTTWRLQHAESR